MLPLSEHASDERKKRGRAWPRKNALDRKRSPSKRGFGQHSSREKLKRKESLRNRLLKRTPPPPLPPRLLASQKLHRERPDQQTARHPGG